MENTNTNARKSATPEQIAFKYKNLKDWNILELSGEIHLYCKSVLEFAQSHPATLDKGEVIAYCAMQSNGNIYYATEKLIDKDFTFWSPTFSDGKLFSSIQQLKDRLKDVDNYIIKEVRLKSLSEQSEAKQ